MENKEFIREIVMISNVAVTRKLLLDNMYLFEEDFSSLLVSLDLYLEKIVKCINKISKNKILLEKLRTYYISNFPYVNDIGSIECLFMCLHDSLEIIYRNNNPISSEYKSKKVIEFEQLFYTLLEMGYRIIGTIAQNRRSNKTLTDETINNINNQELEQIQEQ